MSCVGRIMGQFACSGVQIGTPDRNNSFVRTHGKVCQGRVGMVFVQAIKEKLQGLSGEGGCCGSEAKSLPGIEGF